MGRGEGPAGIDKIIRTIRGLPDRTQVGVLLGDTDVDDDWLRRHGHGFSSLSDDVGVVLVRTRITDEGLTCLRGADNITTMWLAETAVSDAGLDVLREYPNLDTLLIEHTRVTDDGLAKLADFPSLWMLSLDSSQFTDVGAGHLQNCAGLESIRLHDADDASVARLAQLPNLGWIDLDGSGVTDASLPTISSLKKLRYVTLRDCEISDAGCESLRQVLQPGWVSRLTSEELEATPSQ